MKQTAVEFLFEKIKSNIDAEDGSMNMNWMYDDTFEQAKEIEKKKQDKFAIDFYNWCKSGDAEDLLHDLIMVGEVDKNITIEQILEIFKNK
jgi:hypothetical protein